jgi:DNA repair protein RadC
MGVHDGHRERVKDEVLKNGLDHLPPHRVLEYLLFFSRPRGNTNELAHNLIQQFGSLGGVLDASYDELLQVEGVGRNTALLLGTISQVARLYYREKADIAPRGDLMEQVAQQMVARYVGYTEERFTLVCLDNKLKILFFDMVAVGVADSVQVQFRTLAQIALRHNATGVILGHNHPSGMALPSRADRDTTEQLVRMFKTLSIDLLDHIIVAGDDYVSMAQSGMLSDTFHEPGWRQSRG